MTVWVILPAFNEEESLKRMLPKIHDSFEEMGQEYRILVVNDGSSDDTAEALESASKNYKIDVITHSINRGLGETERDAFEYVAKNSSNDDIIIRMDCDDTHESGYFLELIKKIKGGYDVVAASRFQRGGKQIGVNAYRVFISFCANMFMKLLFNIKGIEDYSCGFRAYRAGVIKYAIKIFGNGFIQLKGLGFTSTLEMIVKLELMGCRFIEIPFVLRYDQKCGPSKMVTSATTLGYFAMAVLYYWPFGGWRNQYKGLKDLFIKSPDLAVKRFSYLCQPRSILCKIGG